MKKQSVIMVGVSSVFFLTLGTAFATDIDHGKKLHDASCITECHSSRVKGASNDIYTRKDRFGSLEEVRKQVSSCNQGALSSKWQTGDEADVVAYLNSAFYHFK